MAGLVGASAGNSDLSVAAMMAQLAQSSKASASASQPVEKPQAYYVSPYTVIDTSNSKAVLVLRDSATGDIQVQVPATVSIEKSIASEQQLLDLLSAGVPQLELPEAASAQPVVSEQALAAISAAQVNTTVASAASVVNAQNFSAQAAVPDARAATANFATQAAQVAVQVSANFLVEA